MTEDDDRLKRAYEAEQAVIRQALDMVGPWPASTTSRTQNVEVLDVDRYGGFAVVLAAIEHPVLSERLSLGASPALQTTVFRSDNGSQSVSGSVSGGMVDPLLERPLWSDPASVILRRSGGRCRLGPPRAGQTVCHAEVFCAPSVTSVVVDRPSDRRFLDVVGRPGWIAIVWPEGAEPRVTAVGSAGEELDDLDPALFRDG